MWFHSSSLKNDEVFICDRRFTKELYRDVFLYLGFWRHEVLSTKLFDYYMTRIGRRFELFFAKHLIVWVWFQDGERKHVCRVISLQLAVLRLPKRYFAKDRKKCPNVVLYFFVRTAYWAYLRPIFIKPYVWHRKDKMCGIVICRGASARAGKY